MWEGMVSQDYRLDELFYYYQDWLQDAQVVVQVFDNFTMEVVEVVGSEFVGDSAVQEAFEAVLDMAFGRVQVWGSVYKAWGMIVVTQVHMNFPSNYVAKADLKRVGYSNFATDSIVDNY